MQIDMVELQAITKADPVPGYQTESVIQFKGPNSQSLILDLAALLLLPDYIHAIYYAQSDAGDMREFLQDIAGWDLSNPYTQSITEAIHKLQAFAEDCQILPNLLACVSEDTLMESQADAIKAAEIIIKSKGKGNDAPIP